MYTIISRAPTKEEGDQILRETQQSIPGLSCLAVVIGWGAFSFGWIGGCAGGFVSEEVGQIASWTGWGIGAILFIWILALAIPSFRRMHKKTIKDKEKWLVEEISVTEARAVEVNLINGNAPNLAIQIGDQKILFLQGQWLLDTDTYDAPDLIDDSFEEFVNGLPAPHSFPSTAFTVIRLPHSGAVLHIRVSGNYLAPEKSINAPERGYEFGDSELFDGSVDEIASVLARGYACHHPASAGASSKPS